MTDINTIKNESYYIYARDVIEGRILACLYVKQACQRFLDDLQRDDLIFRKDKVDKILSFYGILKHFKGQSAGQNFHLQSWQEFIVAQIIGWYWSGEDDLRRYTSSYIEVARKAGKDLDIDTDILTTDGWKTFANIEAGDYVYGADGKPTKVMYVTPPMQSEQYYKITFEDNEEIIAGREHNWYVKDHERNERERVMTTEELSVKYFRKRRDKKGTEYFYRVPMNTAIEMPEQNLAIDPYVLGLWLGDGTNYTAEFTVHKDDLCMYDYVRSIYGDYVLSCDSRNANVLTIKYPNSRKNIDSKLYIDLKNENLIRNKHIPEKYLYGSIEQRLALLQGLMDTDGACSMRGHCEIQQKNTKISDGICALLSSLGIKYNRVKKIPTINKKKCDEVDRISFFTDKTLPCFRLKRKYDRLKDHLNKRMQWKSIIKIEKCEPTISRCISVDNDSNLFCVGKRMTVTHNTALMGALCTYMLFDEPGAEVDLASNCREQAKIAYEFISEFSRQLDPKGNNLKIQRDRILVKNDSAKILVFSADASKLDGFNASFAVVDEFHENKDGKIRNVIKSSMGQRKNPHLCTITTAGFDKSLPCFALRTTATEILSGVKQDDSLFTIIFTLDENDNWKDENVWAKANPNLGITVSKKYLKEQVISAINNPSEEVGVRTKNLNQWVNSSKVWIPDTYVNKVIKPIQLEDFYRRDDIICYCGVDLSQVGDLTATCFLFVDEAEKMYSKIFYYLPEDCLQTRKNKEWYQYMTYRGFIKTTPGNVVDYDYITNDLMIVNEHVPIQMICYDKWNATKWAIDAQQQGLNLYEFAQNLGNFNKPTKELERLILRGTDIVIDYNEVTLKAFRDAKLKCDWNGNAKLSKDNVEVKIDGIIALCQALGGYLSVPRYAGEITVI